MAELKKLGRYEIIGELGRGGMGIVLKGRDPHIDRDVALKIVKLDEVGESMHDQEMLKRFYIEAKAAGKLQHPNIVTVYDAGEEKGRSYIAMEYVEGEDLSHFLKREGPLSVKRAAELVTQVAGGLAYAHDQGVIHRDIKPGNILINKQGLPKITDFGLARFQASGSVTQTGHAVGSPSYMSPEQVQGKLVDGRSDLFSLGVMFYELITGLRPFEGESLTTLIYKIIQDEPIPPHDIVSSIPPAAEKIIDRLLNKDMNKRFKNGTELVAALAPLITGVQTATIPKTSFGSIDADTTMDFDSSAEFHRANGGGWGGGKKIVVTLALFALVGLGLWFLPGDEAGEPPSQRAAGQSPPPTATLADSSNQPVTPLIAVDAKPSGEVFIDNRLVGQTPLVAHTLSPGAHVVRVVAKGYRVWSEEVTVVAGDRLKLTATLQKEKITGQLVIPGPRGATVRIDDAKVGVAPLTKSLSVGEHTLHLSQTGRLPHRQKISVVVGKSVTVDVTLEKRGVGALVVTAIPWADIYLDGVKMGTTPKKMTKVYGGKRRIRLVHPDYRPYETTFDLAPGKRVTVRHVFGAKEEKRRKQTKGVAAHNTGVLSVTSKPQGPLFVDGERRGVTPIKLSNLPAGKHAIILKRPGYIDYRRDITIIKGRTTQLSIE